MGAGTSINISAIIEKLGRMDTYVKNFEQKLTGKVTTDKQEHGDKRKGPDDENVPRAKVTKQYSVEQKAVWDKINEDTTELLSKTKVITNQNKHDYLDLMKKSEENNNCMRKKLKLQMYSIWGSFSKTGI